MRSAGFGPIGAGSCCAECYGHKGVAIMMRVVHIGFNSQEDCLLTKAEGRPPREGFYSPSSCCCTHFGSDWG